MPSKRRCVHFPFVKLQPVEQDAEEITFKLYFPKGPHT